MKISTKGRYGVRFLMDLAVNNSTGNVTLKEVAARQEISEKYLWQVASPLKAAGLIRAASGPGGGYALARTPEDITLREILAVLEGDSGLVPCAGAPSVCPRGNECAAREIWREVEKKVGRVLDSFTLGDMAERERSLARYAFPCYEI